MQHPAPDTGPAIGLFTAADLQVMRTAVAITNSTVLHTLASEAPLITLPDGSRWWDTRPMLDPREHAPASIDLAREYLHYALSAGLVQAHGAHAHLVRRT